MKEVEAEHDPHDSDAISARTPSNVTRRALLGAAGAFGLLLGAQALGNPQSASAAVPFPLSNPYTRWQLRDDFAAHQARGSTGPGVDYGLPNGTPVAAPAAGSIAYTYGSGSGGWFATITHPGGFRSQLLHLSGFSGSARGVSMGEIIGFSGGIRNAPGAGSSTGAHLHWSLISGNTHIDPLPQVNTVAGQPVPPAAPTTKDEDMIHYLALDTSANGMIGPGQRFVQGADGPLRCITGTEWAPILFNHPGTTPASWSGNMIADLISRVGLREYVYDPSSPGGIGRLTGRILYGPAASAGEWPKVQIAT